jgi:ketosteroid isomerase-like protein
MKNLLRITPLMLVVLMGHSLSLYAETPDEFKGKIEKINAEMAKAMMAGKNTADLGYYATDVISMPNNDTIIEGLEALKKSNEEMMKMDMKVTSFKTTISKVTVCNNLITEIGKYEISLTSAKMTEPMSDMGKYLTIWEKQADGSLKIKLEMWNTDMNPMMAKE